MSNTNIIMFLISIRKTAFWRGEQIVESLREKPKLPSKRLGCGEVRVGWWGGVSLLLPLPLPLRLPSDESSVTLYDLTPLRPLFSSIKTGMVWAQEPNVLFTSGHQRPELAGNCQGVVKGQEEKQGLTFLILVFETGYLSSVSASERVFYYFPCICQSKEEQDKQVSLLGQIIEVRDSWCAFGGLSCFWSLS